MSVSISQDQPAPFGASNEATNTPSASNGQSGHLRGRFLVASICAVATGIVAHENWPGSIVAAICVLPLGQLLWQQRHLRVSVDRVIAILFTCMALTGVLIEPGPLNISLFWFGLAALALVGHGIKLATISTGLESILRNVCLAPFRVIADAQATYELRSKVRIGTGWIANLVLPLLAIGVFGTLLAIANPLIANFMSLFSWDKPLEYLLSMSTPIAFATFLLLWIALRMSPLAANLDAAMSWAQPVWHSNYFKLAPVIATLLILNVMFASANALDYTYIWRGVTLPPGMSMVEYVHRGSHSLIATALLAGALIIAMFQPGSATSNSNIVRALVYLFAAQNVLLVASSAMRTMVYVDEQGLTLWRISAFIWMGLVALGLALIALRVMFNRTNLWLLNTNLAAALLVLLASGIIDYKAIVAETNVNRALTRLPADPQTRASETQLELDIPYLLSLGPSALPALERMVLKTANIPRLAIWAPQTVSGTMQSPGIYVANNADAVLRSLADEMKQNTRSVQSDWRTWTLRFARQ